MLHLKYDGVGIEGKRTRVDYDDESMILHGVAVVFWKDPGNSSSHANNWVSATSNA